MKDTVTICICTFGSQEWIDRVDTGAYPSALATGATVKRYHLSKQKGVTKSEMLTKVRNLALKEVNTEFVVYLDGDDELDKRYVTAMLRGEADLRAPSRYIAGSGCAVPKVKNHGSHICEPECLKVGNYIVVGAMARVDMLRAVGGWRTWEVLEDWDMWQRCYLAGYSIETIPLAKYIVNQHSDSRSALGQKIEHRVYCEILEANGLAT